VISDKSSRGVRLHEETLIHTARGLVEARHLTAADTLFVLDENRRTIDPAKTSGIVEAGACRFVEVTIGTRTIRVSPDTALVSLVDGRRPGRIRRRLFREWIMADDLRKGDIVGVARKTPDVGAVQELAQPRQQRDRRARDVRLPTLASDDLLWWSGLYAGDGYIHHSADRRRVEFAIPATQPDVREELIAVSWSLFGVQARARDEWRVVVPGIRLADYVEAIGLGGTALQKRVPSWVFLSPETHRLAFLGGYVDSDGDIRTPGRGGRNKDMGLTSGNPALLEDARRLAVLSGVRTSTIWDFTSRHPHDPHRTITGYRMRFSGDFDRIACRSARRIARMHQRKFFHNNTSVGGIPLKSHTSDWLGFARVETVVVGAGRCVTVAIPGRGLVAEGIIVGP
jgi:Fe-S cluster assembly protein SufB